VSSGFLGGWVIRIFLLFFPHSLPQPLSRPAGRKRGASFGQLFKGSEFNLTANLDNWDFVRLFFTLPAAHNGCHWRRREEIYQNQSNEHPRQRNSARVRPTFKNKAKCGCWLPFPPRRGWKGAGGIGGEYSNKEYPEQSQKIETKKCPIKNPKPPTNTTAT